MGLVVVGADGTLGRVLAERLGARPVLARCPDPLDDAPLAELEGVRVVVNAAGPRVRPDLGWRDYLREHVGVTSRIARSMARGSHLVHVSSTAVYGARGVSVEAGAVEAPTLFPSPAYACAKLAAEHAARAIGSERGVKVTAVRPSMVYGPGIDSALSTLRRLARRGVGLRLTPAGVRQHLVHIDLLVAMIERLVQSPTDEPLVVAADPFVLTNEDLALRASVVVPVPVSSAWSMHRALLASLGVAPASLEALAVLALDCVFDSAPSLRALAIDPSAFARERTFDPWWNAA
jgi:nucleoside-diphosphate-sugar epimerase